MKKISQADNFKYLSVALTLLLLGMAFAQQFSGASIQRLMQSATVVTLLVAIWDVENTNADFLKALLMPVLIIITAFGGYFLDHLKLDYLHLILMLLFFITTSYQTAKQVLFQGDIDTNKILGSICLYILLGLIFSLLFTLIYLNFNDAFNGVTSGQAWYVILPDFVYFSFVTLTTLGYGDISPIQPIAKFLVYFEAMVGQFYLAILVASLVGSKMSSKTNQ